MKRLLAVAVLLASLCAHAQFISCSQPTVTGQPTTPQALIDHFCVFESFTGDTLGWDTGLFSLVDNSAQAPILPTTVYFTYVWPCAAPVDSIVTVEIHKPTGELHHVISLAMGTAASYPITADGSNCRQSLFFPTAPSGPWPPEFLLSISTVTRYNSTLDHLLGDFQLQIGLGH